MSRHFLVTLIMITIIFSASAVAIMLAKGYKFSSEDKKLVGTGIISVKSDPDSASVYLDDHLTTATNSTIPSLPPKEYVVKVIKEGFIPWQKTVRVQAGLVNDLKLRLFPAIPTIYPLTFNGVKNPTLSPDGSKLVFVVPVGKKAGIWVWTMVKNQPIAFARSAEPHQILQNPQIDYSKAVFRWSSDSKQVVATTGGNNYLLDSESLNTEPRDITANMAATIKSWEDDMNIKNKARVEAINNLTIRQIASESSRVKWSPDETMFMYGESVASNSAILVYDLGTGKNSKLPLAKDYIWIPDSPHVVLVENNKISVVEADGSNQAVIYVGNFLDDFVFVWPDSSRLVMMSTFPTPTASEPNLYGINLR